MAPATAPAMSPATTIQRTIRPNTPIGRALRAIVFDARYRLRRERANTYRRDGRRRRGRASSAGDALERRDAVRHVMEALLVDGEDHHLWCAEQARIVEGADLQQHGTRHRRRSRQDVRAAVGTELARHRFGEVGPAERLGRALDVREATFAHPHDDVRVSARDVLAFSTVALPFEDRITRRLVA